MRCGSSQHENGSTFCYVDECGFGMYTASTLGIIHSQTMIGGVKQSDFDDFITTLFGINFGPALEGSGNIVKGYIILDNAPCHRGVENRLSSNISTNTELVRLPPYSCELNPIGMCFNSLKACPRPENNI